MLTWHTDTLTGVFLPADRSLQIALSNCPTVLPQHIVLLLPAHLINQRNSVSTYFPLVPLFLFFHFSLYPFPQNYHERWFIPAINTAEKGGGGNVRCNWKSEAGWNRGNVPMYVVYRTVPMKVLAIRGGIRWRGMNFQPCALTAFVIIPIEVYLKENRLVDSLTGIKARAMTR